MVRVRVGVELGLGRVMVRVRHRVRVMVRLGIGLGLGFRSGQSQCVPLFRSVNYHILEKYGTRRIIIIIMFVYYKVVKMQLVHAKKLK